MGSQVSSDMPNLTVFWHCDFQRQKITQDAKYRNLQTFPLKIYFPINGAPQFGEHVLFNVKFIEGNASQKANCNSKIMPITV